MLLIFKQPASNKTIKLICPWWFEDQTLSCFVDHHCRKKVDGKEDDKGGEVGRGEGRREGGGEGGL